MTLSPHDMLRRHIIFIWINQQLYDIIDLTKYELLDCYLSLKLLQLSTD